MSMTLTMNLNSKRRKRMQCSVNSVYTMHTWNYSTSLHSVAMRMKTVTRGMIMTH